jgi:hypothetical protein
MSGKAEDLFLDKNDDGSPDLGPISLAMRLYKMVGITAEDEIEIEDDGSWVNIEHRELPEGWVLYCCEGLYPYDAPDGTDADLTFCCCLYKDGVARVGFANHSHAGKDEDCGGSLPGEGTYFRPREIEPGVWRWQECGPDCELAAIAKEFIEGKQQ